MMKYVGVSVSLHDDICKYICIPARQWMWMCLLKSVSLHNEGCLHVWIPGCLYPCMMKYIDVPVSLHDEGMLVCLHPFMMNYVSMSVSLYVEGCECVCIPT